MAKRGHEKTAAYYVNINLRQPATSSPAEQSSRLPAGALMTNSLRGRHLVWASIDATAWSVTLLAMTAARLSLNAARPALGRLLALMAFATVAQVGLSLLPRFHHMRSRRGSSEDAQNVLFCWAALIPLLAFANFVILSRPVPTSAFMLGLPLALSLMLGARLAWRLFLDSVRRPALDESATRIVVFGAGRGGEQIIHAMMRDPKSTYVPVALLDDDPSMSNRSINGVKVRGTRDDLATVAQTYGADEILVAIPTANSSLIKEIDLAAKACDLRTRVLPTTSQMLGMLDLDDIRELTPADLLGRDEVTVDTASILEYVQHKRVLVTGGGGSIGSELCRQLSKLNPAELFILDRDETALHNVQLSIEGKALLDTPNLIVADIRDAERVNDVFASYKPDVVFHTAALKHLTLLEQNVGEGVKTNVWGTANLLDAAVANDVEHFVNVSTDKAANPTSVLGATKLVAERLTAQAGQRGSGTYASVRFGNVLGSRGSVLPTFREQIALGGPITITHPDVTRYFMTIPEAVTLVLQAGALGETGEIMVLDMGEPVKIVDLAEQLIRQSGKKIEIQVTGLRAGEKLHEILIGNDEVGVSREHTKITHAIGSTDLDISDVVDADLWESVKDYQELLQVSY